MIEPVQRKELRITCGHYSYGYCMAQSIRSNGFCQNVFCRGNCQRIRNYDAEASRVVGLTGTPAPNGLIDLWSQIYLLDRGERLGKFLTRYRDEYFKPGKRNGAVIYSYVLRSGSEERIHDKIKDICMSMKAKDYLTLPERMINIVPVVFDDKLKQSYRAFEQEQVLALVKDGVEITALSAATLSNKLLQFANGAIYDENHVVHQVHDLKIEAVKELLDDANGNPVLIAWTSSIQAAMVVLLSTSTPLTSMAPRELLAD